MTPLRTQLEDLNSQVKWIRDYRPENAAYDSKRALQSMVILLAEIVREIETLKTTSIAVDNKTKPC